MMVPETLHDVDFMTRDTNRRTDAEDTLRFAERTGLRPMTEKYPPARTGEALRADDQREGQDFAWS